jgi:hypothetical protein
MRTLQGGYASSRKSSIFFLIFGIWVGPSLGLGFREKNEENKRALSPLFSSFFHLELGGESLEERAKERLRVQICENLEEKAKESLEE